MGAEEIRVSLAVFAQNIQRIHPGQCRAFTSNPKDKICRDIISTVLYVLTIKTKLKH